MLEKSGSDLLKMGSCTALRVQDEFWKVLLGERNLSSLVEKNRKEGVHRGITPQRGEWSQCAARPSVWFSVSVVAVGLPPLFLRIF